MEIKKRALLIGLNYTNTNNELGGCINDTINLQSLIKNYFNYSESNITIMTDDKSGKYYPIRENIIYQLDNLITQVIEENLDEIWISYSGHGSYTRDTNRDETDNYDEVICPLDYSTSGGITDDTIHKYLARIPTSCRVICLFDCCHSGTICDLQYKCCYDKQADTRKRVRKRVKVPYKRNGRKRYRYRRRWVWKTIPGEWKWNNSINNKKEIKCSIISISGCRDPQTSADVFYQEMGKWNGALSKAFVDNIKNITEEISCRDLCLKLNKSMLDQKLTQKPVICTSYNLNPNQLFFRKWDLNNICIRT